MFTRFIPLITLAALALAPAAAAQDARFTPPTRAALSTLLQKNFATMDTNGDGTLNATELQAAATRNQQQRINAARTRLEGEFTKLDTNKDGQLSKTEFMAALPSAPTGAASTAPILAQFDGNRDGKITAEEYRGVLLSRFDAVDTNKDGTISDAERKAASTR